MKGVGRSNDVWGQTFHGNEAYQFLCIDGTIKTADVANTAFIRGTLATCILEFKKELPDKQSSAPKTFLPDGSIVTNSLNSEIESNRAKMQQHLPF